jgi:endonuclease III
MDDAEAETVLTNLPGVGVKTAKCVLMYSLGRALLPVDTHVARVSRRLGLAEVKGDRAFAAAVEGAVPPDCHYDYHVNALQHGREVCRVEAQVSRVPGPQPLPVGRAVPRPDQRRLT